MSKNVTWNLAFIFVVGSPINSYQGLNALIGVSDGNRSIISEEWNKPHDFRSLPTGTGTGNEDRESIPISRNIHSAERATRSRICGCVSQAGLYLAH